MKKFVQYNIVAPYSYINSNTTTKKNNNTVTALFHYTRNRNVKLIIINIVKSNRTML